MTSCSVLVIDDSPDFRELLAIFFEGHGFRVDCVCNGQEALAYLKTHDTPSVIILDLHMPVMDGREFYYRRMEDEKIRLIPVLLYSSATDSEVEYFPREHRLIKGHSLKLLLQKVSECFH